MPDPIDVILTVLAALVLLPLGILFVETVLAIGVPTPPVSAGRRGRAAILIPAHNEEAGIGRTLASVKPQLQDGDRIVVVADNCTDKTADVARSMGAEAVERTDPTRKAKSYALEFGVASLSKEPPEVVVIMDADCEITPGTLDRLVRECCERNRPTQALYFIEPPAGAGTSRQVSAFAFQYRNTIRPVGLWRMGFPCLLTGTGMAFPWDAMSKLRLGSAALAEDQEMGVALALAGVPPRLCPGAEVHSELPVGDKAAVKQRTRWEQGHLMCILTLVPRLLVGWARTGRVDLLALAADLFVPPLSLLFLSWAGLVCVTGVWWLLDGWGGPFSMLAGGGLLTGLAIFVSWLLYGRDRLPAAALLRVPGYALGKLPIYLGFVVNRQKEWVRAERAPAAGPVAGSGPAAGAAEPPAGDRPPGA